MIEMQRQCGGSSIDDAAAVKWLLQIVQIEEVSDLDQGWPNLVSVWA